MRILFQGDSITDAGRDRRNYYHLGEGYPKYAAAAIRAAFPDKDFEFINLGISGNRSGQLFDRSSTDLIELQPDIVSILIGINDVWHRFEKHPVPTTDEQFELNYRTLLKEIKKRTDAKIMMISPFLLDAEKNQHLREGYLRILPIVRRLADEFADVFLPINEYFDEALKTQLEPLYYSGDAVHPNSNGAAFIGEKYAEAIKPLIV